MSDPLNRFSNRVKDYAKYRPNYPPAVLDILRTDCNLTKESVIADVGSGTGILTEVFLRNGNLVFAVEPNAAMREVAETTLKDVDGFISVNAAAEATTLASNSVDFVVAAQAFHWFEQEKAKAEFARILKLNGWVVLIWNERRLDSTPFLRAYEELLLHYGTDYQQVRHENVAADIPAFFAPNHYEEKTVENAQQLNLEGLKGRLLSSSYAPARGHNKFEPMIAKLEEIFRNHNREGAVTIEYDTRIYYGRLENS